MATEAAMRVFFSSPKFAVVGASSNPAKFGHKVFCWYLQHALDVTAINPTAATIAALGTDHIAVPSLRSLEFPADTGVSIITPPKVTLEVLREAKELGVKSVFLQPGTFDDQILKFALEQFEGGVAGDGYCVLVDGDRGLGLAGRVEGKL